MKEDIKTIKELLYRLEDITSLGVTMPLVAFTQLRQHLPKLNIDDPAMKHHYDEVKAFIDKHSSDFEERDERAISRGFQRMKKKNPDRLDAYRTYYEKLEMIESFFNHAGES